MSALSENKENAAILATASERESGEPKPSLVSGIGAPAAAEDDDERQGPPQSIFPTADALGDCGVDGYDEADADSLHASLGQGSEEVFQRDPQPPSSSSKPGPKPKTPQQSAMEAARGNDEDSGEEEADPVEGEEDWPDCRGPYSEKDPVTLPLGPHTKARRMELSSVPVLAAVPEAHEATSIFLMQMPTDLRFPPKRVHGVKAEKAEGSSSSSSSSSSSASSGSSTNSGSSSSSTSGVGISDRGGGRGVTAAGEETDAGDGLREPLKPGHVGTLRVHKSGKVTLRRLDGSIYEVHNGTSPSFCQYLAGVTVDQEKVQQAASIKRAPSPEGCRLGGQAQGRGGRGRGSGRGGLGSRGPVGVAAADMPATGDLYFMGSVQRKWVLTPTYDIGTRRSKPVESGGKRGACQGTKEVVEGNL